MASAFSAGADLAAAQSPWSEPWIFRVPQAVPQPPVLRSPANGASVNSGRLEWSHPLYPGEALVYEVELTTDHAEHQQAFWVHRRPQSPSLRDADRARLSEAYFPVVMGTGGTLYWRVRASRAEGLCAGPWSDWWSFTWTGPAEGLGGLPAPTCITNAQGECFVQTVTAAPSASRTPRPTGTRTATLTATFPGGVDVTVIAFTATSPPTSTKTPIAPPTDTKEPPPTDKPKDTDEPQPTEQSQPTEPPK